MEWERNNGRGLSRMSDAMVERIFLLRDQAFGDFCRGDSGAFKEFTEFNDRLYIELFERYMESSGRERKLYSLYLLRGFSFAIKAQEVISARQGF